MTIAPTFTPFPLPTSAPNAPDTGWSSIQPGLEKQRINIYDEQNILDDSLRILRLSQGWFRFDVAYSETPKSLAQWVLGELPVVVMPIV